VIAPGASERHEPCLNELVRGVLAGERRSIARALSQIEDRGRRDRGLGAELVDALYTHTGRAHLIGVTGPPGTGKSTLINRVAGAYRQRGARVGIIAVDPSSAFSGGALLGDRVRMRDLAGDPGVFVRSMATRGAQGGLGQATWDAAQILDAAGYEIILVETVGVGQDEIAVAFVAHTVVVVQAPGWGDDVQAIKAGLMEIGDIYVLNKADLQGADPAMHVLQGMLERGASALGRQPTTGERWPVPVCKTVALDGTGVDDLVAQIDAHQRFLVESGRWVERERRRAGAELQALLRDELYARFVASLEPGAWEAVVDRMTSRQLGPYQALEALAASARTEHC
jgi:LAO/AO transport system kinase